MIALCKAKLVEDIELSYKLLKTFLLPAIFTMSEVMYVYIINTQNTSALIGASIWFLNFHVFRRVKHPGDPIFMYY